MFKRISLAVIVFVMVFSCIRLVGMEQAKAQLKRDQIELNHIKYGLFNVDAWKKVLATIITKKIREFKVTKENRPAMKRQVEEVLVKLVDEAEKMLKQENEKKGFTGWVRGGFMSLFDVMADVRKGIPGYADKILDYMEDPKNKAALQANLIKRLNEMVDKTIGETDYTVYNEVLARHFAEDKEMCLANIDHQLQETRTQERIYLVLLVLCCAGAAGLILLGKQYGAAELGTLVAGAAVLLFTGLSLPMIDIEATIASFSFTLVGEEVSFTNQVLFFQSKSILQVVRLLLQNGGFGLVVVALLVFTFSVLIPIAKLIASVVTIHRNAPPRNALHRFLVFKSGKWSMADVMVVAIFMSYIGFNGVINSQLTQLTAFSGNVELFTTNNSVLQTGFYLFTGYCIIGLLLSAMIDKRLGMGIGRG